MRFILKRKIILPFLSILFIMQPLFAQETGKKAMIIDDYGRWRSIGSTSISTDGNWITFSYRTPNKNDTLFVKNVITEKAFDIPQGANPRLSENSEWAGYLINTDYKEAKSLRKAKKPVPRKAQLLNLTTGEKNTWNNAAQIAFAKTGKYFSVKKTKSNSKAKHNGTDLILRNLEKGFDLHFGSVLQGSFNKPGTYFAFTVDGPDKDGNGLYLIDLNTSIVVPMDNDTLTYSRLTWDEEGSALAVLKGKPKKGYDHRENVLLAFTGIGVTDPVKTVFDPADEKTKKSFPKNYVISEKAGMAWTTGLDRVFFGIKEQEKENPKLKNGDLPSPDVDIWHWKDDFIQPVQKRRANRDKNFTFQAVLHLDSKKFVRLTDKKMKNVRISRDGKWGIGINDQPYMSDWKENQADYYRVNIETGERKMFIEGQKRTIGLSPDSKHFLYWKDSHVWSYDLDMDKSSNLTENSLVSFVNMEWDYFGTKPLYGVAGWTKDEKAVILYHRYDIFLQPFDGSPATNLTGGIGDENEMRLRYIRLDREEKFIDLSKPALLSAYGQWNKKSGYYWLKDGMVEKLVYEDRRFGRISKAKNADRFLFTAETFHDFPNYYVTDSVFNYPQMMTDANPWQVRYNWGKTILFDYTNNDGKKLQGFLAIPDSYKPGMKYPMLVQFYEKYSQDLHRYIQPTYRDTPMGSKYVSNGYLFMKPDVHFRIGSSHTDMLECVEAAVKKVIEMGYADPKRIGLHGHSYSGGGATFISTRSTIFAAIAAGAAPINLAGEFNILFHSSGQNNHSYDIYGQGRYGTNPFDDFELYREQSPITGVRNMNTPLLYFHGDADGSVEYNQGVEFYNALRFNGKPIIFASYPNQGHHLNRLENKIDYQTRMEQFYDHYLKSKPAQKWMTDGISYLEKLKKIKK